MNSKEKNEHNICLRQKYDQLLIKNIQIKYAKIKAESMVHTVAHPRLDWG